MLNGDEVRRMKSLPRPRRRKSLGNSDRELSRFIETLSEPIAVFDDSERIVLMNGHAENLFGYGQGELRHQKMELLVPEHLLGRNGHQADHLAEPGIRPRQATLGGPQRRKRRRATRSSFRDHEHYGRPSRASRFGGPGRRNVLRIMRYRAR